MEDFSLSAQSLKNLKFYKYRGPGPSIFEILFLNKFWDWLVTLYPPWLTPNRMTLSTLVFPLTAYFVHMYLD